MKKREKEVKEKKVKFAKDGFKLADEVDSEDSDDRVIADSDESNYGDEDEDYGEEDYGEEEE